MRISFDVEVLRATEHLRMNTAKKKIGLLPGENRIYERRNYELFQFFLLAKRNLWSVFQQTANYV